MFAIGDKEWAGMSKLIEEAGEVIQVCGKLLGTRGDTNHWDDGGNLADRLEDELSDLLAAINFVVFTNGLNAAKVNERWQRKYKKFKVWHEEDKEV